MAAARGAGKTARPVATVEAFLKKHADHFVREVKADGVERIKCTLTGHEMPLKMAVLEEYLLSRKYLAAAAEAALNAAPLPDHIVINGVDCRPSDKLFCKLTGRLLNKSSAQIEAHVNGRRYRNALDRWTRTGEYAQHTKVKVGTTAPGASMEDGDFVKPIEEDDESAGEDDDSAEEDDDSAEEDDDSSQEDESDDGGDRDPSEEDMSGSGDEDVDEDELVSANEADPPRATAAHQRRPAGRKIAANYEKAQAQAAGQTRPTGPERHAIATRGQPSGGKNLKRSSDGRARVNDEVEPARLSAPARKRGRRDQD